MLSFAEVSNVLFLGISGEAKTGVLGWLGVLFDTGMELLKVRSSSELVSSLTERKKGKVQLISISIGEWRSYLVFMNVEY